jgi:5-methylcytosine-specific restriction endonuclease McrA
MRFIDLERLEEEIADWPPGRHPYQHYTPQKWRERLLKAEAELHSARDSEARSKVFTRYSDLWSDVKVHLQKQSMGKCWYCETKVRSFPGDIDHYRPKGRVAEAADHPGYWWLAFEWRNWRFICRFCNSLNTDFETGKIGGKANKFPLLDDDESGRIKSPDAYEAYEDLWRENPALLDPTEREDIGLITFTSEGLPEPVEKYEKRATYKRAKASIETYFLDCSRLKNERKKIYAKIKRHVEKYNRFMSKWDTGHNRSDYEVAKEAGKVLGRMIAPDAEYSMTTIDYLQQYLRLYPDWTWINKILTSPSMPVYASIYVPAADTEPDATDKSGASS